MGGLRVAVLSGGQSSEREASLASGALVLEGLEAAGHVAVSIDVGRDGAWYRDGKAVMLEPGRGVEGVDVVFPMLHGPFGEDGTVQGLLECLGVAYVGAGVLASAVCMDKLMFKELMASAGVLQTDYHAVRSEQFRVDRDGVLERLTPLGLPVFVKPARLGSSFGVTRVLAAEDLPQALGTAFEYDSLALVEAAASGIEVECAVIGNERPVASAPGELVVISSKSGWRDVETQFTRGSIRLIVPARLPEYVCERIRELAVSAFVQTRCRGLARVDFFVDGERILINEINTMPGLKPTSVFSLMLMKAVGLNYPEMLDRLVQLALECGPSRGEGDSEANADERLPCQ
ncbi:MAG: D-alanine--D-alanine ligase family protein [Solirubrobacteraceae bacterium]